MKARKLVEKELRKAGIIINGSNPWDIQVHREAFFSTVFKKGSLGLGEAYMDSWWDVERLHEFFYRIYKSKVGTSVKIGIIIKFLFSIDKVFSNFGSKKNVKRDVSSHYDINENYYRFILGKYPIYSCAYYKDGLGNPWSKDFYRKCAEELDFAQENKLELICKKLQLSPGMKVLDIGCGCGTLANYMTRNYGVDVLGITLSKNQKQIADKLYNHSNMKIELIDYRDVKGKFDRVVSIGMFEHVGWKKYKIFMKTVNRLLRDEGIFLLHTIGGNKSYFYFDPWIDKYIFPGATIPNAKQIVFSANTFFSIADWHELTSYSYTKTLCAWFYNYDKNWNKIISGWNYNDREQSVFYRTWKYYLLSCAGSFLAEHLHVWQILFTKKNRRIKTSYIR